MSWNVYLYDTPIGRLTTDRGRLAFSYAAGAHVPLSRAGEGPGVRVPHRLSIRLPLRESAFNDDEARPFFENLLPEDESRRLIAAHLRLSASNTAALLGAIGGECAGAVSVWPVDEPPPATPSYRSLGVHELGDIFSAPDDSALIDAQRAGRLSLAGAQPKLVARRENDTWALPLDGGPTTHLLKRTRLGFPHLVENEYFVMTLAARCGIPVPKVEVVDAGIPILAIERFDRVGQEDGTIARLHQEDFCQATGTPPQTKYEAEGGPGFKACAELLRRESSLPVADLAELVRWAAFNLAAGNEDAHAKNVALLYGSNGLRLAPFYDMVCSAAYKGLSRKSAMAVGGEYRAAYVERRHWERFAADIGIPFAAIRTAASETFDAVDASLPAARASVADTVGDIPLLARIYEVIAERVTTLRKTLANR